MARGRGVASLLKEDPVSREIHCPLGDGDLEADDDEQLLEKVRAHAAQAHPELTEEQIQEVMAQGAHDSH
jgi:hypothetical protein